MSMSDCIKVLIPAGELENHVENSEVSLPGDSSLRSESWAGRGFAGSSKYV
jgi:hypothetical protein